MLLHISFALCFPRSFCTDILFPDSMQYPPESVGRGGWSNFDKLLGVARREYREFLMELCHNPIFTHRIFSGVGTQNETA